MNHSEVTARVAVLIAHEPADGDTATGMPWMRRLCRTAVERLDACGVGVCVVDGSGVQGVAAASNPISSRLVELQFVLGEGPCVDAHALRRPVLESALREGHRWPGYTPGALEAGAEAVFAFPLQVGAARLGVLDVYRGEPGALPADALVEALSFAELAVESLLDGQEAAGTGSLDPGLADALDHRTELYQAQGMVMVDLGVTLVEAMARLRAHAYATDRSPGAVARDVVAGRLVLEADPA